MNQLEKSRPEPQRGQRLVAPRRKTVKPPGVRGPWPGWLRDLPSPSGGLLGFEALLSEGELMVGEAEEDEAEDGDGVLGGLELGVSTKLVGGVPEAALDVGKVSW